ncbi:hypothetical protein [Paenarthrobacter ureafaciens]|uniref:hypothetical protein n=1 Tax=Paenarthrobacter ureafaciens TaxID=37931 RepID=UPI00140BA9BF|nr:hypothetical protein [Paenarthrobacter ureafaciens]MCX8453575.1 hypothetical protein [Paenarthrobacter ureafaciens]MCY0973234.1 hypothetical protein [Paenarthrobacter ureafaciens]
MTGACISLFGYRPVPVACPDLPVMGSDPTFADSGKESVENVHSFHPGLARTGAGLARIPHVSAGSGQRQGREWRSSPTSGTA